MRRLHREGWHSSRACSGPFHWDSEASETGARRQGRLWLAFARRMYARAKCMRASARCDSSARTSSFDAEQEEHVTRTRLDVYRLDDLLVVLRSHAMREHLQ